ncbi:GFA family protein [Sphingomonas sp. ZT3P38]|uniref:GFA family protein n=1 Tax=Parasphingomonas zepuensis TaxID=3096161 RepID=UPI002FCA9EA9
MTGLEGGCACSGIRYRLVSEPFDAGYCHCRICQLSSGAPVMAFATVPRGDLHIVRGVPAVRRSSDIGERWFCGECGTPLAMTVTHQPETIDFTIATLDVPRAVVPKFHIWTESRIGWFEIADAYDRHERFRPGTMGPSTAAAAGGAASEDL